MSPGACNSQFNFEQQAAVRFIKKDVLKPPMRLGGCSIGTTPKLVKPRTTNAEEAITGVTSITPVKAATALFDSVTEASKYLGKTADPGSRRVLIVISDGEENYSVHSKLSDAMRELQKNDCLFYSINPGGVSVALNNKISVKGQTFLDCVIADWRQVLY